MFEANQYLLLIFPALLLAAAVSDIRALTIPNWIPIALCASFPLVALAVGAPASYIGFSFLVGGGALLFGFCLFALRILGGGDAKLIAASAAWIGFDALVPFLLFLGIAGGVLSLAVVALRYAPLTPGVASSPWLSRLRERGAGVPYGAAIAAAGAAALPLSGLFAYAAGGAG